jgi:hypothetical protein
MKTEFILFHAFLCAIGCVLLIIVACISVNVDLVHASLRMSGFILNRVTIDICFIILFIIFTYMLSHVIFRKKITLKYRLYVIAIELIVYFMIVVYASYRWYVVLQYYGSKLG